MIQIQLLLLSQPQPSFLPKMLEPLFPQPHRLNKIIIQIIELHPHPSLLHPQFVAVKSLISDLLNIIYSIDYVFKFEWLQKLDLIYLKC